MQHFSEITNYPPPLSCPLSGTAAISPDFGAGQCAASFSTQLRSAAGAAALRDLADVLTEEAEGAEAAAFAGPVVLAIRRGEVHR